MSAYELDDDTIREALSGSPRSHAARDIVFAELEKQLPIPVPARIGAVVETKQPILGTALYIRWAHDNVTTSPWIEAGNHEEPYRTDEIGRIVKVLSEGVDL